MFFLLTSFFVLIISTFLFKRAAGSLSLLKPNMINYLYYYQVLAMTFIAALLVVNKLDEHYVINRVSDEARLKGWLSVMYMMVIFPLGLLLAKWLWIGKTRVKYLLISYTAREIDTRGSGGKSLKYSVWIFTAISSLACLYTFYVIGYFPFIKALTTSSGTLDVIRINSSLYFTGNVYIKNILALALMPVLSYAWFFYYIASRRMLDLLVFMVTFILSASILYYDFSKGPLLWYLLSYLFGYYYALGGFKLKHFVSLAGVTFALLVAMYAVKGVNLSDFLSYNTGPVGRIILGQAAGTYYMFDIFPAKYDYIGFASISQLLSNLFGYEYIDRAARIAMIDFNPRGIEAGTAGVINTLFVAEAWANWGLLGVLVAPLWVGFIIGSLYYFFLKKEKNPLWLAFFVAFSVGGSFTGGFNDYIYNAGYLILVFLVFSMFFLSWLLRAYRKKIKTKYEF